MTTAPIDIKITIDNTASKRLAQARRHLATTIILGQLRLHGWDGGKVYWSHISQSQLKTWLCCEIDPQSPNKETLLLRASTCTETSDRVPILGPMITYEIREGTITHREPVFNLPIVFHTNAQIDIFLKDLLKPTNSILSYAVSKMNSTTIASISESAKQGYIEVGNQITWTDQT